MANNLTIVSPYFRVGLALDLYGNIVLVIVEL